MMKRLLVAILVALSCAAGVAIAQQNSYLTPTGSPVPAMVPININPSGQAVVPAPVAASTTGTTAAVTATLTSAVGKTVYICGFSARGNATAATSNTLTVGGLSTTLNFLHYVPATASGVGLNEQLFIPCLPASATSTNIVVSVPALGGGGLSTVSAWGFTQ